MFDTSLEVIQKMISTARLTWIKTSGEKVVLTKENFLEHWGQFRPGENLMLATGRSSMSSDVSRRFIDA